jgi:putative iron-regulated protein
MNTLIFASSVKSRFCCCLMSVLMLASCAGTKTDSNNARDIVQNYAAIGLATYEDAHDTALALQEATNALLAAPSAETLEAARAAWKQARIPYQQSEAFRFGNRVVDEWEGRVNSWPLDEGLIDYVAPSYGDESDLN